jgi:hypothetical protein
MASWNDPHCIYIAKLNITFTSDHLYIEMPNSSARIYYYYFTFVLVQLAQALFVLLIEHSQSVK